MNKYRAKSQLYQVFIKYCNNNLSDIVIPKLNIQLYFMMYDNSWRTYISNPKHSIIASSKKEKSTWIEFNHFKIENQLINLLNSNNKLNLEFAIELLKMKINKIEHTK